MGEQQSTVAFHNIRSQLFRIIYGSGAMITANRDVVFLNFFSEYPKMPDEVRASRESSRTPGYAKEILRELEVGVVMHREEAERLARIILKDPQGGRREVAMAPESSFWDNSSTSELSQSGIWQKTAVFQVNYDWTDQLAAYSDSNWLPVIAQRLATGSSPMTGYQEQFGEWLEKFFSAEHIVMFLEPTRMITLGLTEEFLRVSSFTRDLETELEVRPIERVRDLLGRVESGLPDLGSQHRALSRGLAASWPLNCFLTRGHLLP